MNESISDRDKKWDEFLTRWPLNKLEKMTLQEYSKAGNTDTFTYWLESITEKLGSIWGGSSFKFGVYSRDNQSKKEDGAGRSYSDDYAWYTKYGDAPESAFKSVIAEIIKIANAAYNGDLKIIDDADLGEAVKWKIAFLYQNRDKLNILPVYKSENLRAALGDEGKELPCSTLHQRLMLQKGSEDFFSYADEVWRKGNEALAKKLTKEAALNYLQSRFSAIKEPVQYMAGFSTSNGRQLGLVLQGTTVSMFLEQANWPELVSGVTLNKRYTANEPRISSLGSNAPKLSVGNLADKIDVHTMSELIGLCDAYEQKELNEIKPMNNINKVIENNTPLNQILYGPPGTGKTYATIDETLNVLAPDFLQQHKDDRAALKTKFDSLVTGGHVRFVTFHQSFSYEDFVEGLRPETTDDGQVRYEVVDGVFKSLCDAAAAKVTLQVEAPINLAGRVVWKMSLGNTLGSDAYIYDECIENGYALLGYGELTDFSECKTRDQVFDRLIADDPKATKDSYAVTSISTFVLKMKIGDLIVVTDGNTKFRAIGEISGNYRCLDRNDQGDGYGQCRDVKWLRVYKPSLPFNQLMNNQFSQMTLYELRAGSIDMNLLAQLLQTKAQTSKEDISNSFKVGDSFGTGYVVISVSADLVTLKKPMGNTLPLGMSLLHRLAEYVQQGRITISDIRDKQVFTKVTESELDPYLVNGYANILAALVDKLVINGPVETNQQLQSKANTKVLIIDEINRGSISRIFGELITLIEPSKRAGSDESLSVTLPYSKTPFSVPSNVYLIGTMNTADRSLTGLDVALRRRFTFKEMPPRPELLDDINIDNVNIGQLLRAMNDRIEALLDRDRCLGHAYFISLKKNRTLDELKFIFRQQILPLLQEYFFEDWERIAWVLNCHNKTGNQALIQKASSDLTALFDNEVANNLQNVDRRWHINEDAFNNIGCYRGILGGHE
jgi:5-methylcytosine-specific restriction protein B